MTTNDIMSKVTPLFEDFEKSMFEVQRALDAADQAAISYREAATVFKGEYLDKVEKAADVRMNLYKDRDLLNAKLNNLRAQWSTAAMQDLNDDAAAIDKEIERVSLEIRKVDLKISAIEGVKVSGDQAKRTEILKLHEARLTATSKLDKASAEARNAAMALATAVKQLRISFLPVETVPSELMPDKLDGLQKAGTLQEILARKQAEELAMEEMAKTMRDQAARFAEQERQIRIRKREAELLSTRSGKTVTVDGKEFIYRYDPFGASECRSSDGQLLRDYLDSIMPLTEEDYRNGGFRPDGERY